MLKERQKLRYQILQVMFDATVGKGENPNSKWFPHNGLIEHFVKRSDFSDKEISSALEYLRLEGLLRRFPDSSYELTHGGATEIERNVDGLRKPEDSPPSVTNITQNFSGQVGAVQNASHSTAHVNQPSGANLPEVFTLIEQLKGQVSTLPEGQRKDASDTLEAIEAELNTEKPRWKSVKAMLKGLIATAQSGTAFTANASTLILRLTELGVIQ